MFIKIISLCLILAYCSLLKADGIPTPVIVKSCALEKSCGKVNETSAICRMDDSEGCIRKYASKCHMDIAACKEGKKYIDYSDVYCTMESYICEETPTYARWTIFFGHEKD